MITRGYFIGEIIDELAGIAYQVESRCALGLTDLNIFLENFFKEILNKVMGINMQNLNTERSNAPGLDIGDNLSKVAFQITSQKTSAKINETLKAVLAKGATDYDQILICIIGHKQKSYTLDSGLCKKMAFSEENIWDMNKLCKMVMDLPIGVIQSLHHYIKQEMVRVKVELEIPDTDGKFPTSVLEQIESIPKPIMSDFKIYYSFHKTQHPEWKLTLEDVQKDFEIFCQDLLRLPRITREFYAFLLERRDGAWHETGASPFFRFNHDRLKRICHYPDTDGEIRLLAEHGFVDMNEPDRDGESPYVRIFAKASSFYFLFDFIDFIETTGIGLQKPIVHLNFGSF